MPGLVFYSSSLLSMAYSNANRADTAAAVDPPVLTEDTLTSIVLAASAAEGFLNDLVGIVDLMLKSNAPATGDVTRLGAITDALNAMEESHAQIRPKYLVAAHMLATTSIQKGAEPYQSFDNLIMLRNGILHARPLSIDADDRRTKIAALLAEKGLARPSEASDPSRVSGTVWINQIQTPAVAWWAADVAQEIMVELANGFAAIGDFSGVISGFVATLTRIRDLYANSGGA